MALLKEEHYTIDDIYSLPEGQRAELINGVIHDMAPPNRLHQKIVSGLHYQISDFIKKNNGSCEVYPAPFAVFLNQDNKTYVEPDISVICDASKLDDRGCNGAPDWIIEVASPATKRVDFGIKLFKYRSCGVREYWIVNPLTQTINVYDFETDNGTDQYSFNDDIPVCIYDNFTINLSNILNNK